MIRIGLLSDTHSYIDDRILSHFEQVDEIWHAGDIGDLSVADTLDAFKPLRAVYGNIDNHEIRAAHPEIQHFELEGLSVAMIHIGGYPGRYSPKGRQLIADVKPRLYITGHSHILKVMNDETNQLLHLNPGAVGKHGFHKKRTMMRFEIEDARVQNLEIIELGNR